MVNGYVIRLRSFAIIVQQQDSVRKTVKYKRAPPSLNTAMAVFLISVLFN